MTTLNELIELQTEIAEREAALIERNEAAFDLWTEGMTQREIAEHLDAADRAAGGPGVTQSAIAKVIYRMRRDREAELMASAT